MNMSYKYRAFISYSHTDKAFSVWVQKKIENYVIPKALRKKYPHLPKDLKRSVFRDDEELYGALTLSGALENALDDAERLIVLCSAHAVESQWVENEIVYFKSRHDENHIYTVILNGEAKDVIPKVLGDEVLAIDVQHGKKLALMKILASLLDVPFSDMWEREKREAKKRLFLRLGMGLIFLLVVLYSVLQYNAITSNAELEALDVKMSGIEYKLKHDTLNTNAIYALQNRLQTLKEIKKRKEDTLKWFGMVQTSLAKKAKKVYDDKGVDAALAILESENSQMEDADFAKKNILRAKLYIEKDDYEQANMFYDKAVAVDGSYENMYEYVLFLMKEHDTQKAQVLLERLHSYDLNREQKANVLNRLGINYRKLKRLDEAETSYMDALKLRKELARENPKKYRLDLAWTYNNLGVLYKKTNELNASEQMHYKAYELRKELAKQNPKKYMFYVTCSMHNLGELYRSMKDVKSAESFFKEAIKIRRELIASNPQKYMPTLANSLHELATLYVRTNRQKEAKMFYKEALKLRTTLATQNPQAYSQDLKKTRKALDKIVKSEEK